MINQIKEKEFVVAIGTPYLYASLERLQLAAEGTEDPDKYVKAQIEKFGFNPDNNLSGKDAIYTGQGTVRLVNRDVRSEFNMQAISNPSALTLVVLGSAGDSELEARQFAIEGAVVGRYSIFYGNASNYSGLQPEESGYSLDFPKDPSLIKNFLQSHKVMDALDSRNLATVVDTIQDYNRNIVQPVLITPALEAVLQ